MNRTARAEEAMRTSEEVSQALGLAVVVEG